MANRVDLPNLLIGVSTSALQIEGGDRNNNWYDWAMLPGRVRDGSSPLRATDHWNRWREDTELMSSLGLQTYRMGVEWARIEPKMGEFDDAALQHYRDEIAAVRAGGMVPLVTLHHFTNPRWFEQMGQFTSPYAVQLFLRFTKIVVEALGDLVNDWVTINEPNVYATQAHLFNEAPPGQRSWGSLRTVLRHLAEAHCGAYDLIHRLQPSARVGFAHHMRSFAPLNPRNPVHRGSARLARSLFQEQLADAMALGKFSALFGRSRRVRPGRYYDFLGLNYYSRTASSSPVSDGTFPGRPVNDLGWEIYPEGIVECAAWLVERYDAPVWITENGTCDNGSASSPDRFRSRFIFDHLAAIASSDLPIERYYHWCFVDNWEWSQGEVPRFGIVALDFETQTRTVKPSGRFLSDIIANGGVTKQAYDSYVAGESYSVGS